MAVYPPPTGGPRATGVRSTTILTKGQGPALATGKQMPTLGTSKPLTSAGRIRVTAEDLKDPARLVKVINDLQGQIDRMTVGARSNPHSVPCIVRNLTSSAIGATVIIPHTLGRPFTGWWGCRSYAGGNPFSALEATPAIYKAAGQDTSKVLILRVQVVCTFDVCITGD